MESIKDRLKKNVKFFVRVRNLKNSLPGAEERRYQRFIKMIQGIDPISDINMFREAIDPVLQKDTFFSTAAYGPDSFLYGYYNEIVRYSGRHLSKIPMLPMFEHGIRFASPPRKYDKYSLSYACQGRNRIHEIHSVDPWKMVFSFGPYIHYAEDEYDQQKFESLKKQLGNTLLVFPAHTWEESSLGGSNEDFLQRVMRKYAPAYDNVLVCMYWKNVNDPVAKAFETAGAKIVSAGFRGDSKFVRRLKTIIRLADDVVVDDIGTNIGFSICMKKRVFFEGGENPKGNDAFFTENYRAFKQAFSCIDRVFSQEQLDRQHELYTSFWGGEQELLTKSQTNKLFEALEAIYDAANYNVDRLPNAEKKYLVECVDYEQKKLIRNAISPDVIL